MVRQSNVNTAENESQLASFHTALFTTNVSLGISDACTGELFYGVVARNRGATVHILRFNGIWWKTRIYGIAVKEDALNAGSTYVT